MEVRVVETVSCRLDSGLVGVGCPEAGIVIVLPRQVSPELVHLSYITYVPYARHARIEGGIEPGIFRSVEPRRRSDAGEIIDYQDVLFEVAACRHACGKGF